jgi:hypothetical protein
MHKPEDNNSTMNPQKAHVYRQATEMNSADSIRNMYKVQPKYESMGQRAAALNAMRSGTLEMAGGIQIPPLKARLHSSDKAIISSLWRQEERGNINTYREGAGRSRHLFGRRS